MKRKVPEKVVLTEEGWSLVRGSTIVQGGSHSVHLIRAVTVPETGFYLHVSFHVECMQEVAANQDEGTCMFLWVRKNLDKHSFLVDPWFTLLGRPTSKWERICLHIFCLLTTCFALLGRPTSKARSTSTRSLPKGLRSCRSRGCCPPHWIPWRWPRSWRKTPRWTRRWSASTLAPRRTKWFWKPLSSESVSVFVIAGFVWCCFDAVMSWVTKWHQNCDNQLKNKVSELWLASLMPCWKGGQPSLVKKDKKQQQNKTRCCCQILTVPYSDSFILGSQAPDLLTFASNYGYLNYSCSYFVLAWYNRNCWLGVKHQVTYLLTLILLQVFQLWGYAHWWGFAVVPGELPSAWWGPSHFLDHGALCWTLACEWWFLIKIIHLMYNAPVPVLRTSSKHSTASFISDS